MTIESDSNFRHFNIRQRAKRFIKSGNRKCVVVGLEDRTVFAEGTSIGVRIKFTKWNKIMGDRHKLPGR